MLTNAEDTALATPKDTEYGETTTLFKTDSRGRVVRSGSGLRVPRDWLGNSARQRTLGH